MQNNSLRSQFLLQPDVVFLNHGSFGACPKPVFETFQRWQLELEQQPVAFLGRRYDRLMDEARTALSEYIHASVEDVMFVPNATAGVNVVARSLDLQPGDEILTTDHEYGAVNRTWAYICQKTGAEIVRYDIPRPLESDAQFVEGFFKLVTPRTKIIAISHITSPTALTLPIAAVCHRARELGILTVVDGAHALGHIPLDMQEIGADFYTSNAHKWLCSPKNAAFLYVRREHHSWIAPLIISAGWVDGATLTGKSQWQGTQDISAYLSVPAAIAFMNHHKWDAVRARCHDLAQNTQQAVAQMTGITPLALGDQWFSQMVALPIPDCDVEVVKTRLLDEYMIEVPVFRHNDQAIIRVSYQGYNTQADADALIKGIRELLSLS